MDKRKKTPLAELARIAFRSMARHKTKTVLTVLAVMVSVALYIAVDGWLEGMNLDSRRNIVAYETGAAKLQTALYFDKFDDRPMYENFGNWETYGRALEEAGYVYAPRFVFSGTLYSAAGSAPMEFIAGEREKELEVLRWGRYIENGKMYRDGVLEMVLGEATAEKLKTGVPMRPLGKDLEELLGALPASEREWARGLYEKAGKPKQEAFGPKVDPDAENDRFIFRKDVSDEDRERYWQLLADTGRMDVRMAVVIDIKMLPDEIVQYRWEEQLMPKLSAAEREMMNALYEYDVESGKYLLSGGDKQTRNAALEAMVKADFSPAIRHLNQMIDLVVAGTVNSPNPKNNNNTAFLPMDMLQDETGLMLEGKVTELVIRAANADDSALPGKRETAEAIKAALEARLGRPLPPELGIEGWAFFAKDYLAASAGDNISTRIMVFILFILSFLGIANTMLLAILERTREIGMMRAMGMTDAELTVTYLLEAGMLGLAGSLLGLAAGCLINIPMVNHGIDFSAMTSEMGGDIGYRVAGAFRSVWNIPVIIAAPVLAAALAAVSAFIPVRKAVKMEVTDSLRFS
jgi:ABC-type lipoprotein release transport system permease subunit